MDGVITNAVVVETAQAILLGQLKPDSPVFLAIDTVLALLLMILMPFTMRTILRLLAPHEADDSLTKSFLVTQLILILLALLALAPFEPWLRVAAAVLVFLACVVIVKSLCWLHLRRAGVITLTVLVSWSGLAAGVIWLENQLLPPKRLTLADQVRKAMGVIDEFAGQEAGDRVFDANTLHNMKMGLRLETEALIGAIHLLKNPNAIQEMTAEHTEDLKTLDLLGDGKMPSPEELKELGITEEEVVEKRKMVQRLEADERIDEKDVEELARFIRSTRPGDEPLTAQDIARVLLQVKKRHADDVARLAAAAATGGVDVALSGVLSETNEAFMGPPRPAVLVITSAANTGLVARVHVNPLDRMTREERNAWLDSEVLLKTSGMMRKSTDKLAMVNGQPVRTGEVVWVESAGRSFAWRLVDVKNYRAYWEAAPELCH